MKHQYTVMPFLVALVAGIATMGLDIYQVNAWNVGTLKIEPWRQKATAFARSISSAFSWLTRLWTPRLALCSILLLATLSAQLSAAQDGMVMLAIGAAGVPDFTEVKTAIESGNRLFEEFKRTNDERLKQLEAKGVADPLLQQKLDKLNEDIEKASKITDAFAALEAKVNRIQLAGTGTPEEAKSETAELKAFSRELKSNAQAKGRAIPGDVTVEEYRAYKRNLEIYLRRGDRDSAFDVKAMSVGSDPDGGYVVTPDMSGRMVTRRRDLSPIRQIAAVQTISTDKLEGTRDIDEVSGGGWVGETASRAATTTPQIGVWAIPVHEQYENPGATQKLLDDASIDIETWLANKVADKMARREGTAFVGGTGVAQPRGYASYTTAATADGSRAWGTLEHVATGTAGGWGTAPNGSDKLIDLVHKFRPHFRQAARWVMNRVTLGSARQLKANAEYIWLPSMMVGQPSSLLGYPITEAEDMATYTTTDALAVALGDFQAGYQIVDRIGIRVLRDPYTNKPYVQFYTTARVGGDVIDFEAIKFLKFGTS